mgnify:CR=1 FL=1
MKKKFKYLLFIILINLFAIEVHASSSKVQVGDTVKVTVTVSTISTVPLGSWEFAVGYDTNTLTYVSSTLESGLKSSGYTLNNKVHSKTYTLSFKAKKAGTGTVTIKNPLVVDFNTESPVTTAVSGASINIVEPVKTPTSNTTSNTTSNQTSNVTKAKSANNYLSAIAVSGGYVIAPKFDKNVSVYNVTVPNEVRSIKIAAKQEDAKAKIAGTGVMPLKEGKNKFNIIVVAENGNKRTYTVNVTVKELNPVIVNVGGEEYSVVQKKDELEAPTNYIDTTVTINATEVPAFTNEITKYNLVGLTDKHGNTKLYIYNDDTYIPYTEYTFSGIRVVITEPDKLLSKSKEITLDIEGDEIVAYQLDKNTYPLIHGLNVETGEENWYTFDSSEKTIQKE